MKDNDVLNLTVTQQLLDEVMAGRTEVYCRVSPHWIKTLISSHLEGEDSDEVSDKMAEELSWSENRGMLQCGIAIGNLHLCRPTRIILGTDHRRAVFESDGITIRQTADRRQDIFVIRLGKLIRINRINGG